VIKETILIISANHAQAKFIADFLSEAGYQTWMADQEEIVIPNFAQELPSLVILDWGYLNSNDKQFIRNIKANEMAARVPILVMGVEMAEEDVLGALEAGADVCLNEKLQPRVLVARVQALLRRMHPN
jgi:DNA-binding response OmpR family regulator